MVSVGVKPLRRKQRSERKNNKTAFAEKTSELVNVWR